MALEVVRRQNLAQIRVAFKGDSHQIVNFAFKKIGAHPQVGQRGNSGVRFWQEDAHKDSAAITILIARQRNQLVDHAKTLGFLFGVFQVIDANNIREIVESLAFPGLNRFLELTAGNNHPGRAIGLLDSPSPLFSLIDNLR